MELENHSETDIELKSLEDGGSNKNLNTNITNLQKDNSIENFIKTPNDFKLRLKAYLYKIFRIKERNSSIRNEVICGCFHFLGSCFILAVIPQQLASANFNPSQVFVVLCLASGLGSIFGGLISNIPVVIAPATVVNLYYSVSVQTSNCGSDAGSFAVILSGTLFIFLFFRPVATFIGKIIPIPIRLGTTLGVGLFITLAGAVEIDLIMPGNYSLLQIGHFNSEIVISLLGVIAILVGIHYNVKGISVFVLLICTMIWWSLNGLWPTSIFQDPQFGIINLQSVNFFDFILSFELFFLYNLYFNGLVPALSEKTGLVRDDGTIPRGRWLYLISGFSTLLSGIFLASPILISPEASGIKAGAKTGLSTVICGMIFLFAILLEPVFSAIPPAGTSPILMISGLLLFQDANLVDWKNLEDTASTFTVLFAIPFTYSVLNGVILGYLVYILFGIFTGKAYERLLEFLNYYFPTIFANPNKDNSNSIKQDKEVTINEILNSNFETIKTSAFE